MNRRSWSALLTSVTLVCGTPAIAQTSPNEPVTPTSPQNSTAPDQNEPAPDQPAAGDIVVYGLKGARAQELQRTPIAVTAVNADAVDRMQLLDVLDVGRLVPNAGLNTAGSYTAFPAFEIRGIGVALSVPTLDPAVTVSVDGMPYAFPVGTNIDTFDIDSLEVFRGPQGVVQGRNSTGGVVLIRSRRPSNTFEAELQATVGNYGRADLAGYISGPIVADKVLAKLAIIRRSSDSFFENGEGGSFAIAPNNPTGTNPIAGVNTPTYNRSLLVRPTIEIKPTENFTVTLLGEYSTIDNKGPYGTQYLDPPGGLPTSLTRLYGYTPPTGPYAVYADNPDAAYVKTWRGIADLSLEVPDVGVFTSITGYRTVKYIANLDNDETPFLIFHIPDTRENSDQFSQELRFASTFSKDFEILVGGYYSNYDLYILEKRVQSRIASGGPYNQYTYTQGITNQTAKVAALFANLSWHLTDRLTLTAGGRYNYERKNVEIVPLSACSGTGFGVCPTLATSAAKTWKDFSPRASIEFQARSGLLFYASYTKGFRSGAFNSRATSVAAIGPTDPESVTSFEAGMKSSFLNNSIRVNLTGFHAKYDDIQRTLAINTLTVLVNAAKATIDGVEAEITVKPVRGLQLDSNLGYLHARYDAFNNLPAGVPPPSQLRFPDVPKYTASLSAAYEFTLPGNGPRIRASTSYNYRSGMYLDTLNPAVSYQKGYGLLDASLSVSTGGLTLTAFGRNLANVRYRELVGTFFSAAAPLVYTQYSGRPRTYGLEAKYRF